MTNQPSLTYASLDTQIVSKTQQIGSSCRELYDLAAKMRDSKLYKQEFPTWDDYCKARFRKTSAAFRMIEFRERRPASPPPADPEPIEVKATVREIKEATKQLMSAQQDGPVGMRYHAPPPPEPPPLPTPPEIVLDKPLSVDLTTRLWQIAQQFEKLTKREPYAGRAGFATLVGELLAIARTAGQSLGLDDTQTCKTRGTLEEVRQFCFLQKLQQEDADWFYYKNEGCGWKNSGKPIKDWRATVIQWKIAKVFPSQKPRPVAGRPGFGAPPAADMPKSLADKIAEANLKKSRIV